MFPSCASVWALKIQFEQGAHKHAGCCLITAKRILRQRAYCPGGTPLCQKWPLMQHTKSFSRWFMYWNLHLITKWSESRSWVLCPGLSGQRRVRSVRAFHAHTLLSGESQSQVMGYRAQKSKASATVPPGHYDGFLHQPAVLKKEKTKQKKQTKRN